MSMVRQMSYYTSSMLIYGMSDREKLQNFRINKTEFLDVFVAVHWPSLGVLHFVIRMRHPSNYVRWLYFEGMRLQPGGST